jgi:hypothetical protein
MEYIFIVFIFTKHFLSLLLVFFKFLNVDKVYKVWFKLGKYSFLKEQGYIYNLFPIHLTIYIIKILVGPDLGKVRL